MAAVCSRCNNLFDHAPACPRCGEPHPGADDHNSELLHGPRWQQTALGRILIGLIIAQGMFYGFRHLATGLLLASADITPEEIWSEPRNLFILQGIQLFGLFIGCVLAGGGQRNAVLYGGFVGAWNGVLAVLLGQIPVQEGAMLGMYGQPVLHIVVGGVSGLLGSLIWRPIPLASVPVAFLPTRKPLKRKRTPLLAGRIHYIRILIGTAVAVVGTLLGGYLFYKAMALTGGVLGTTSRFQDQMIIWEIKALAMFLGGALAGATTTNGLKQGLFVGLATSVVLIGLRAQVTDRPMEVILYTMLSANTLCLAGGWFGGTLLPRVIHIERRAIHAD